MRASVSPTLGSAGGAGESSLKKELRLASELFARLIDALLNRMFDLRPQSASRRMRYLVVLFLVAGFLVSLLYFPLNWWTQRFENVFSYLLNPNFAATYPGNPFEDLIILSARVFVDPRILQYFPIFLASFFIALQCAALYLADVFELEHVSVARRFIWAVALSGSEEIVRISQGNVSDDYRLSTAYLIGGPGKVVVDLDSVALFEKPDGTPRVIGPTALESRGRAPLEGFERFREAIDIRDQYVDLHDQVKSRSLDGIEVRAADVRLMFSIYRGGVKPSAEQPYPFSKEAVEQIVYKATSRVTPEKGNPSTYEFSWISKMTSLIRGELSTFMSKHKLSAYLASIGMPEIQKLKQREEAIIEQAPQSEQGFLGLTEQKSLPEFQPRHKITNLFTQFAEEFTKKAHSSGVELHWIGVGTWKPPAGLIPEKHLEAWKLSNENLYRESPEVLHQLEKEAILQKMVALIQDVPVAAYQNISSNDQENINIKMMRALLLAYHQQLLEAVEFMRDKGEAVPPSIEEAVAHIHNMFGHFVQ